MVAPAGPDEHTAPERPATHPELVALFDTWSNTLVEELAAADPSEPAWSWSPEQTVAFTYRRQAHEALIHRIDAELAAGLEPTPVDPLLATDGVDEALALMFGEQPPWGTFTSAGWTVRVDLTDTAVQTWAELGRFTGADPHDGARYDEPERVAHGPRTLGHGPAKYSSPWRRRSRSSARASTPAQRASAAIRVDRGQALMLQGGCEALRVDSP